MTAVRRSPTWFIILMTLTSCTEPTWPKGTSCSAKSECCDGGPCDDAGSDGGDNEDVCVDPPTTTFYRDADNDGFGNHQVRRKLCHAGPGGDGFNYVADSSDCDDTCAKCFPGAVEICDEKDNDCDVHTPSDVDFDLTSDRNNCGKCGVPCGGSEQCYQSKCTAVTTIIDIEAGGNNACARRLSGATECWGSNQFGSLGLGKADAPDCVNPDNPAGFCSTKPLSLGTFSAISIGSDYGCAIAPGTSSLSCWGDANGWRQGQQAVAAAQNCVDTTDLCQRAPTKVINVSAVVNVETGDTHTCVVLANKEARCWGLNNCGQTGNESVGAYLSSPQTVLDLAGVALTGVKQLALGGTHSCAALDAGVSCWGCGVHGELGDGTPVQSHGSARATPVVAPMDEPTDRLVAGMDFTCAIRHKDQRVYCWGDNTYGQLGQGDGAAVASSAPLEVKLPTGLTFTDVSAGWAHVCALESGGDVYCWGQNDADQCGIGFANPLTTPGQVSGVSTALEVSLSAYGSCARLAGGVVCWGSNVLGQLGNGDLDSIGVPQSVLLK